MATKLNKAQKSRCKAILNLLIISLLMQRLDKDHGNEEGKNPAVDHCIAYIDEQFAAQDARHRDQMRHVVDRARRKLTLDVKDMQPHNGLVAAMRFLVSDYYHTKPGTRLDYIRQTFRGNLQTVEQTVELDAEEVMAFEHKLRLIVNKI